jgi:hypothetical protein
LGDLMPTAPRATGRKGNVTTIDLSGPFFEHDPAKTFRQNVRTMLEALAAEGEADVKAQIQARAGSMRHYTGWTRGTVKGRTQSLSGRKWAVSAVISTNTAGMDRKDAIRTKAAGSTIEGRWHPFRMTKNRLNRSRKINAAELLKDIA